MNTAVAITSSAGQTAVIIAAIWAGQRFLLALVPQLRIQAPAREAPKQEDAVAGPELKQIGRTA